MSDTDDQQPMGYWVRRRRELLAEAAINETAWQLTACDESSELMAS